MHQYVWLFNNTNTITSYAKIPTNRTQLTDFKTAVALVSSIHGQDLLDAKSKKNISTIIQSIRMVDDIILILMIIQSILSAIMRSICMVDE